MLMIAIGTVNEKGSVHPTQLRPLECRTADHQGCSGGVAEADPTSQAVTTGGNSPVRFAPDQLTLCLVYKLGDCWLKLAAHEVALTVAFNWSQ